jgi:ubiquinone/menaquinone biosynthesis C-methylase UbiE
MTASHVHDSSPNHHADHPPFAGLSGLVMALGFSVGREGDAALAVSLTGLRPDDRVVDIGCGPGTAVRRAARAGASATGVDPAPVMLRVARWFRGGDRVDYRPGRAEALPLPDGAATVVWSIASVHHWPQLEAGLAEVRRVLAPGGRFLAVERHARPGATGIASHGWTDEQADAFAARCGVAGFTGMQVSSHRAGKRDLVSVLADRP